MPGYDKKKPLGLSDQQIIELATRIVEGGESEERDRAIQELHTLARRGLGLRWETQPEDLVDYTATNIAVLQDVPSLNVGLSDVSASPPHLLIEGDNYPALLALQYTHAGKVDVIYIDPPYNTGSYDFAYQDRFVNQDDDYRHSEWLSFMHRRLQLAKPLLSDAGLLFISIDDNEVAHLRLLCDEIFGEENFVACVSVETGNANGPKTTHKDRTIFKVKEYLLVYAQNKKTLRIQPRYEETREYDNEYNQIATPEENFTLKKYKKEFKLSEADVIDRCHKGEIFVYRTMRDYAGQTPKFLAAIKSGDLPPIYDFDDRSLHRTTTSTGTDLYLRYTKATDQVDMIKPLIGKLSPTGGIKKLRGDLWKGFNKDYGSTVAHEGGVSFKNGKKALKFLAEVLSLSTVQDAVVLDFFAGSGTTAHAVAYLNAADGGRRQAILVTNNSNVITDPDKQGQRFVEDAGDEGICRAVTYPRIKGVLTGDLPNGKKVDPLPGSLRYLRVSFRKRQSRSVDTLNALRGSLAASLTLLHHAHPKRVAGSRRAGWQLHRSNNGWVCVVMASDDAVSREAAHKIGQMVPRSERETVVVYQHSTGLDAYAEHFLTVGIMPSNVRGVPLDYHNLYVSRQEQSR